MREIKFRAWFTLKNKMVGHEDLDLTYSKDEGFTFAFDHSLPVDDGDIDENQELLPAI
ncbi:hypothetical protein ACFYU8_25160 [Brevibacillus sp. NPDC003359]|uniref:hypothetical protein n=1 Tax=unclassified Brevibacillus TaxID=2684853 RepID=UPI0036851781